MRKYWLGWCIYDFANSAFATVALATVLPVYFVNIVPAEGAKLPFIEHQFKATVLWSYTVSFSMLIVALSAPYLGSLSDRHGLHRKMLPGFCLLGATATCLLFYAGSGEYLLAAFLFLIANIGFALGNIFYNSFLPVLAKNSEMDRLSSYGFALGYIGGGLALLIVAVLINKPQVFGLTSSELATRTGFLFTGLWWALFALPTFILLRKVVFPQRLSTLPTGMRGYFKIFAELKGYPDLFLFLIAFLFYNDGIQTIITISAVFARDILQLSSHTILACFLMVQFVAMPGALFFGKMAEKFGTKRAILSSLFLFMIVTVYAFFIESALEFWILGFAVAIILGGSQAASRSLFSSLIPTGKLGEFFGFYTLCGKFASILGPFLFAFIADVTGSTRTGILMLNLFFLVGIIMLKMVNVERGKALAHRYS